MKNSQWNEKFVERKVTYTLEANGKLIAIENVPARVNGETGEQLFSADTVDRLQKKIWEPKKTKRVLSPSVRMR